MQNTFTNILDFDYTTQPLLDHRDTRNIFSYQHRYVLVFMQYFTCNSCIFLMPVPRIWDLSECRLQLVSLSRQEMGNE